MHSLSYICNSGLIYYLVIIIKYITYERYCKDKKYKYKCTNIKINSLFFICKS